MTGRPHLLSKFALRAAAAIAAITPMTHAGIMDPNIGLQTYRDFAENRGIFAAGASNVDVYNTSGGYVGTIARVMNFDSVTDAGWCSLTGGASFMATVAHNNATNVSFTNRFGATGVFADSYHFVAYNRGWGTTTNYNYDYATPRLNKIVTEAEAIPYLTDTTILNNMSGRDVLRVGAGTQALAGQGTVAGAYNYLTGGTITFTSEQCRIPQPGTVPPNANGTTYSAQTVDPTYPASSYNSYSFFYNNRAADAAQPLDIGIMAGDSGSSCWTYNDNTSRWEYVSAGQSGSANGNFGAINHMRSGNAYAQSVIDAYNSPTITDAAGGGTITWGSTDGSGSGTISQNGTNWTYNGLVNNVRGATSTLAADGISSTAASDAQMDATRNLVFGGDGGTIALAGSVDMGAGSVTFHGNYTLTDGGDSSRRLNTAGFIIGGGNTVTSQLTGVSGDEWRVVSDINAPGVANFVISGSGSNAADLNVGGNLLVELNRTGGQAVNDLKINGGSVGVRLLQDNQIGGRVIFGHRGGALDLYGHNLSRNDTNFYALDSGATVANYAANTTSTFTYTGSGTQSYLGNFEDGGSLANGLLNVVYNPTTASGATWTLSGDITNKGTWTVSGGEVKVEGAYTLHAGGYVDTNDWVTSHFSTGAVTVADGATFTLGQRTIATSNVTVAGGTTGGLMKLALGGSSAERTYSGNVNLAATTAKLLADTTNGDQFVTGNFVGAGVVQKIGDGILYLMGDNTANGGFTGTGAIDAGTVQANALNGLGAGTWTINQAGALAVNGSTFAAASARIATGSTGTFALSATHQDDTPNLAGYQNLFLGATVAAGTVEVGTVGTGTTLTGWTADGGWNLGGGGGNLQMNLKLTGTGSLNIGNGHNTGTVTLTNINNDFTGGITVNDGVDLAYTDTRALGGSIAVAYGSAFAIGSGADAVTAFGKITSGSVGIAGITGADSNAYDFSGKPDLALGANGIATYSGTLTPGSAGYRFGGAGALTVTTSLTGANAVTIDAEGKTGGVVTLTGTNTFTGALAVQGKDAAKTATPTGTITLKAGSASAFASASSVTLAAGGTLDLNGYNATLNDFSGTGGTLTNSGASNVTATLANASNTTFAGTIANGATNTLALVKTGAGKLTLSGVNTHTGGTTVNGGAIVLGNAAALGTGAVTVNSGGSLDLAGYSPSSPSITLSGTGGASLNALHNSATGTTATVGQLTLAGDATAGGASNTAVLSASGIDLAGHTLTLNTGRLNLSASATITSGNITANSGAVIYLNGTSTSNPGGTGTLTLNTGSEIEFRDHRNTSGYTSGVQAFSLNGGTISNGGNFDPGGAGNGGGSQTTLVNAINVTSGGGTLNGNNWGFGLYLQLSGALSGTGNLTLTGGKGVQFLGDVSGYTGTATIASGSRVSFNGAANQTFNGVLTGAGSLIKDGATTLTLAKNNAYTGSTTINAGTLQITGTLGNGSYSGAIANAGTLAVSSASNQTLSGVISGSGALQKSGSGTLTLSGSNTYAGGTTVNGGTLSINAANRLGTGAVSVDAGGTLELTAGMTLSTAISGNGAIALNGTGVRILTGANTFSGTYTINAGDLVLNNVNAENGAPSVTVNGGRFILSDPFVGDTATIGNLSGTGGTITTLYNGTLGVRTLGVNQTTHATYSGTLTGEGVNARQLALTKSGSATLTLANTNTYTGGTTVTGGVLLAGANNAFGTGAITVNSGGTLNTGLAGTNWTLANTVIVNAGGVVKGAGTITGAITMKSGSVLAPGNSPGITTLATNTTMESGSIYQWEIQGAAPAVAGTDFDQIQVTGGTLTVNSGAILAITDLGLNYASAFWDTAHDFVVAKQSGGTITGSLFTLDTSAAGAFAGQGVWSVVNVSGDLVARWTAVPEPSTYGLLGAGAFGLIAALRRRSKR